MKTTKNHHRPFLLWPIIVCVLGASLLAGCTSTPRDRLMPQLADAESKKTAVVSILGDVFHASYIGASIFSKRLYYSDIPKWGVDEYAEAVVSELIRRNDQYQISALNPKREAFAKVYKEVSRWEPEADNYDLKKIAPMLAAMHEKYGIEVLVLVLNHKAKDPTDKGSKLILSGYGLYHNNWLGAHTFAHLLARLLVVDTQSASLMDEQVLYDFAQVDNKLWHNGLAKTPPKQRAVLEQEVKALLKRNLHKGLVETGLASPAELRVAQKEPLNKSIQDLPEGGKTKTKFPFPAQRQCPAGIAFGGTSLCRKEGLIDQTFQREVLAGGAYRAAVKDLYQIFNMRGLLASYTRAFVDNKLAYNTDSEIYADVYRRWMKTYFKQAQVVSVLHETYQSQAYTLAELKSIAVLAKNKRTRREINKQGLVQAPARQVWKRLARPARLDGLLRAVQKRRELIRREAARVL